MGGAAGLARRAGRDDFAGIVLAEFAGNLSRDGRATALGNIPAISLSPSPHKSHTTHTTLGAKVPLLSASSSPSCSAQVWAVWGAPSLFSSTSASGLTLRGGRRGPPGESDGLCFLWLLWNSLSFLLAPLPPGLGLHPLGKYSAHVSSSLCPTSVRHPGPRPPPPPSSYQLTVTSHNPARAGGGQQAAPRPAPALHPIASRRSTLPPTYPSLLPVLP